MVSTSEKTDLEVIVSESLPKRILDACLTSVGDAFSWGFTGLGRIFPGSGKSYVNLVTGGVVALAAGVALFAVYGLEYASKSIKDSFYSVDKPAVHEKSESPPVIMTEANMPINGLESQWRQKDNEYVKLQEEYDGIAEVMSFPQIGSKQYHGLAERLVVLKKNIDKLKDEKEILQQKYAVNSMHETNIAPKD